MHITRFQALHRLSNIGVARIRNRRHAFFHPAFHLSIRHSDEARMVSVATGALVPRP